MNKFDKESIRTSTGVTDCRNCEKCKLTILELHEQYIARTLRYAMIFTFVALLSIAFHSYIPCAFLLLLFL